MPTINFDMDGTIADLYGVEDWLPKLLAHDPSPYVEARPLVNLSRLARRLNSLQAQGYKLGIISWLSKDPDAAYGQQVTFAKITWLKTHLPSVKWDIITIVPYGTPKHSVGTGILFDDEAPNRTAWGAGDYTEKEIFEILKSLA